MKNSCFPTSASSLQKRNVVRIQRQKFGYGALLRILQGPKKIERGTLVSSGFVCYV